MLSSCLAVENFASKPKTKNKVHFWIVINLNFLVETYFNQWEENIRFSLNLFQAKVHFMCLLKIGNLWFDVSKGYKKGTLVQNSFENNYFMQFHSVRVLGTYINCFFRWAPTFICHFFCWPVLSLIHLFIQLLRTISQELHHQLIIYVTHV